MEKIIIAAIDSQRGIGYKGTLLTHIPEDLKRFKSLTIGHTLIMGRKTWDSLPKKPLPDRKHIILTRRADFKVNQANVFVVHSIEQAFELCAVQASEKVFVIGGGQVYQLALPYVDTLELTHIHGTFPADTFFPPYETEFVCVWQEKHEKYTFAKYIRKMAAIKLSQS
ncbi:MAG: dihydrofolate reductase [Bacteroidia bacterium]|nr:dihydrofolate reductase [Bacteroidia bacterium]